MAETNFKNVLEIKINNFIKFIKGIIPDHKKSELDSEIDGIKNNYFKTILFILGINDKNIDKHIDEFMKKFDIDECYKDKIVEYYICFVGIQQMII